MGALLQIADHVSNKTHLTSYDGNGNVVALFDADASSSATACVARYEYSPYGEALRCEGAYARENSFRFSTRFTDDETNLIYYGYRYYSPSVGRWLARDPIEEQGGVNLYGFCLNNSVNGIDVLGKNPIFTIGGRRYNVTAMPIASYNAYNVNLIRSQGGLVTLDPSKWGISISIIWNPSYGFNVVGNIYNYYYVATPIGGPTPSAPPPSPPGPYYRPTDEFSMAVDRMIPGGIGDYKISYMYDFNAPGRIGGGGGKDAFAIGLGLRNARPENYTLHGNITDLNAAMNHIAGLAGRNYSGIFTVGHGTEQGPNIAGVLFNESMVRAISNVLTPIGPLFVFFANCSAFSDANVVAQYQAWARTYNMTFIAGNMDLINYVIKPGGFNSHPSTWTYLGFNPADQLPGFNWIIVHPNGVIKRTADGNLPVSAPPPNQVAPVAP